MTTTSTPLALLTIGYTKFILPVENATAIVNALAGHPVVEQVPYSLEKLAPELANRWIEKPRTEYDGRVTIALVDEPALPHFDPKERVAELTAAQELKAAQDASQRDDDPAHAVVDAGTAEDFI